MATHWRKFIGIEQKMTEYFLRISRMENWKLRNTSLEAVHVLLVQNSLKTPKTALKLESDTESFKTTFVNLKCVNFQITVNIFCWPKYTCLSRVGGFLRQACPSIYPESLQQASMGPQEHSPANFIEQSVCREPVALLPPQGAANLQNACLQQIIFQDQITNNIE